MATVRGSGKEPAENRFAKKRTVSERDEDAARAEVGREFLRAAFERTAPVTVPRLLGGRGQSRGRGLSVNGVGLSRQLLPYPHGAPALKNAKQEQDAKPRDLYYGLLCLLYGDSSIGCAHNKISWATGFHHNGAGTMITHKAAVSTSKRRGELFNTWHPRMLVLRLVSTPAGKTCKRLPTGPATPLHRDLLPLNNTRLRNPSRRNPHLCLRLRAHLHFGQSCFIFNKMSHPSLQLPDTNPTS